MTNPTHAADLSAAASIFQVEPAWHGLQTAGAALGLSERTLLHAGPPVGAPANLCAPVLNAAVMAVLFEGWAATPEGAERLVLSGAVRLEPAQDRHAVVPLADVLSPSMLLQSVGGRDGAYAVHTPLNAGNGPAMRVGQRGDDVLAHLRWLNGEFAAVLTRALRQPLSLLDIADAAVAGGDDLHGRTPVATRALADRLGPALGGDAAAQRSRRFLAQSPGFFLNLWMAASRCMLRAAEGHVGSSIVTAIGGNGSTFGIQVAGLPGKWFVAPAHAPAMPHATPDMVARGLGAIGDSAVVDAFGLGAMALDLAPETARALAPVIRPGARGLAQRLLIADHPAFRQVRLPAVLSARAVVARRESIMISLGVLDNTGVRGRLAGGLYEPPLAVFDAACAALDAADRRERHGKGHHEAAE